MLPSSTAMRLGRTTTRYQESETMKQWMKWMCMGMLAMTMACGDEVDDDTKVSELDEQQVTDLCDDICGDAAEWELKCGEGNAEITYSGKNKGECNSTCVSVKSVTINVTRARMKSGLLL